MNRAAAGFYLAVVLGSCGMNGISLADELLMRDNFFVADESRHQWVNEHNGRTGILNVKGVLVSSPCILDTTEIKFPLQRDKRGYVFNLKVSGCGYGEGDTSEGRNIVVKQSAVLRTGKDEIMLSLWKSDKESLKTLQHGDNALDYYMEETHYQQLVNTLAYLTHKTADMKRIFLSLNMMYE